MSENLKIANTIKNQISGKSLFMLGAKNLCAVDNGLSFRIGRNSKRVNYIKITLNGKDLYNVEFGWVSKLSYKIKNSIEDIYFDMLHSVIEENTGMYTSL